MEGSEENKPWGKLRRLGAESEPDVLLCKREWTIGRKKACDLSFPGNKLVSGDHCKITVNEESGLVSLEDTSTNGTVINRLKVVKKQTHALQNGDIIHVVYRKHEPEHDVAYIYKSLNSTPEITQEQLDDTEESMCLLTKDTSSSELVDGENQELPSLAIPRLSFEEPQPSTSTSTTFGPAPTSTCELSSSGQLAFAASGLKCSSNPSLPRPLHADTAMSGVVSGGRDKGARLFSSTLELENKGLEPARKKLRGETCVTSGTAESSGVCDQMSAGSKRIIPENTKTVDVKPDKMEETLSCIICQELLHDCVSLQPCMHTFCAACYSGWMDRSSLCPTCRCPVERICKNHILNNLVEAYLIDHPDKGRSEEDVRSMDARNKITQDMLQPKVRRSFSDEEGSSEDLLDLSDVDSESSDISQPYIVCRQCPGYRHHPIMPMAGPGIGTTAPLPTPGDAPSTSAHLPAASQEYTCPSRGSHVICTCCFQPMPDRRAERDPSPHAVPQQCMICSHPFCHMYWGCTRMGCLGCLAPFHELNLGEKCLDGVLNNNNYESDILKNYLASRGLTWKEMLNESLLALQRGAFMLTDYRITANTVLCYCCGLRNFRELAYHYRHSIPAAELPVSVTSRSDCYWGRNCRTQVKAHHAMKFNHICEQTRFKN
ncbi:E3 ubiquitin-protein ligase CHFR isoform X2 [Ambystoma mexicanum]|uniref:E3 ubiquitin-protein ligase CHFR isoform X2 n=1 Tax=Ambystoma mexicanum TaxID=8296 RepID=UPI0037E804C4